MALLVLLGGCLQHRVAARCSITVQSAAHLVYSMVLQWLQGSLGQLIPTPTTHRVSQSVSLSPELYGGARPGSSGKAPHAANGLPNGLRLPTPHSTTRRQYVPALRRSKPRSRDGFSTHRSRPPDLPCDVASNKLHVSRGPLHLIGVQYKDETSATMLADSVPHHTRLRA